MIVLPWQDPIRVAEQWAHTARHVQQSVLPELRLVLGDPTADYSRIVWTKLIPNHVTDHAMQRNHESRRPTLRGSESVALKLGFVIG